MKSILVVDDEPKIAKLIGSMLQAEGYVVCKCESLEQAERQLGAEIFDLIVSDVRLPDGSGIDLLEHARSAFPQTQMIMITAYGTVSQAVEAMRLGAFDYLQKPFEMRALARLVSRALEEASLKQELEVLRTEARHHRPDRRLDGRSDAIEQVRTLIEKVAPLPITVLLQGESGTGKELVADEIHRRGIGRSKPMIRVNCLAIPTELIESELFGHVKGAFTGATDSRKGWFELAHGSTLFLDEIADIPMPLQGKLLRALEEHKINRVGSSREIPIDIRLVTATNVDLRARVDAGTFRSDLYYRLNVFPILIPPLRERREDIPALVHSLLGDISKRIGRSPPKVDDDVLELLGSYDWPGNVRELRNILERASVLSDGGRLESRHLPAEVIDGSRRDRIAGETCFSTEVESFQRQMITSALKAESGVKWKAAQRLGLSPRALSYYLSKLDIHDGDS